MKVALYNVDGSHVATLVSVKATLVRRAYSEDSFSAEGFTEDDCQSAKVAVYADDNGRKRYASFVKTVTEEDGVTKITGKDFRSLFDTEIAAETMPSSLSQVLDAVAERVFQSEDTVARKIPVTCDFKGADINVEQDFGIWEGEEAFNAYDKTLTYLKYYGLYLDSDYDENTGSISFRLKRGGQEQEIRLEDFDFTVETSSGITNKAVAVVKKDGAVLTKKYFYRTDRNEIVMSDFDNITDNRIYPIKAVIKSAETAYQAQYDAIKELADARFNDNILIRNIPERDPANFFGIGLLTSVKCYRGGKLFRTLPVAETEENSDAGIKSVAVKLGFKKSLLTEILKAK